MTTGTIRRDVSREHQHDLDLARRYTGRRRTLAVVLIVVGSVWLCLRIMGVIGDLPTPIDLIMGAVFAVGRDRIADIDVDDRGDL